jgi:hypothetical protein
MILGKHPNQIPEFKQHCEIQQVSYNDIQLPSGLTNELFWALYRMPHKMRRARLRKAARYVAKQQLRGNTQDPKKVLGKLLGIPQISFNKEA